MPDLLRQEIAAAAITWIVKVGTRVLTTDEGLLNQARVTSLAEEIASFDAGRAQSLPGEFRRRRRRHGPTWD